MTTTGQHSEALRLADVLTVPECTLEYGDCVKAGELLRDQHARIAELQAQLEAIGASVEPLRKPAAAQQAVQAAVPEAIEQMAVDRYKVVPSHESMFHRWAVVAGNGTQQLYIGREVECLNMARKFAGAFLDGAFVAMQNTTPTHPAEGVPAQCPNINEPRGCWRVACPLGGKCREPERSATQPAAQAVQPFGWLITKSKLPGDVEFTQDPARENLARSFGYQTQALYDQPAAQGMEAKDAARYRFLRDGDWRENDDVAPFIHLQLNALWDEKIDAALAAQAKPGDQP